MAGFADLTMAGYGIYKTAKIIKETKGTLKTKTKNSKNPVKVSNPDVVLSGKKNGKNYTLDKSKSAGNSTYKKASGGNNFKIGPNA